MDKHIHMCDYHIKTALKMVLAHTSLFCLVKYPEFCHSDNADIVPAVALLALSPPKSAKTLSSSVSLPFHHCFLTSTICCLSWGYCTRGFAPHTLRVIDVLIFAKLSVHDSWQGAKFRCQHKTPQYKTMGLGK